MKSHFPFRGEFEESLNIYPKKIFSLKLEGFLGLLGALPIFGLGNRWGNMAIVSRGTIRGYEKLFTWICVHITRGGVKQFYLTGELCRVHKWVIFSRFIFSPFFCPVKYFYLTLKNGVPWIKPVFSHHGKTLFFFIDLSSCLKRSFSLVGSFPSFLLPPSLRVFFPLFFFPRPFFPQ